MEAFLATIFIVESTVFTMNNDREIEYTLEISLFGKGETPKIPVEELESNSQLSSYLRKEDRFVEQEAKTNQYNLSFLEVEGNNKDFYSISLNLAQWMLLHKDVFLQSNNLTWSVASFSSSEHVAKPYQLSSNFIRIINQLNFGFEYCVYPCDMFHCKYIDRNSFIVISMPKDEIHESKGDESLEIDLPIEIKNYIDTKGYAIRSSHPINNAQSYQNNDSMISDWYDYFFDMIEYFLKHKIPCSGKTLRIDQFLGYMKYSSIYLDDDLLKKISELNLNLEISLHIPGDESNYIPLEYTKDDVSYKNGFEEQKHIQKSRDEYSEDRKNQLDELTR